MLVIAMDNAGRGGDLVYERGCLLDEGYDLETAITMSLLLDAPAQDGDVLPEGTPKRGFWGDVFDEEGATLGSRLWLLEGATATEATAQRAKTYAKEALKWLIDEGIVKSIEYTTTVGSESVTLQVTPTLKSGRVVPLGPFKVT